MFGPGSEGDGRSSVYQVSGVFRGYGWVGVVLTGDKRVGLHPGSLQVFAGRGWSENPWGSVWTGEF